MRQSPSPLSLEQTHYGNTYCEKLEFPFGNFYIFDTHVIGEVNEGVHFNWDKAQLVIEGVYDHFNDRNIKVSYVSHRIHSYSVQPNDWLHFFKERHVLKSVAIVAYNEKGFMSVVLERIFSKAPFRRFNALEPAIQWILSERSEKVSD